MWDSLLAAAEPVSTAEPGLPYQPIGLVLVALVTGITGIVVALVQKGNKPPATSTTAASPPTTAGSFVLAETEWITVRDRSIRTETRLADLMQRLGER